MAAETTLSVSRIGVDDIGTLTQIMGVVDELRNKNKAVELVLNRDKIKYDIKTKLRKYYSDNSVRVTEDQLNGAVDRHFDSLYDFSEPKEDLGIKLANAYVDRGRIFRRRVVPVIVLGALVGVGYGTVKVGRAAYLHSEEVAVEEKIEGAYNNLKTMETNLRALSNSTIVNNLPARERGELQDIIATSTDNIRGTDLFFRKYCDNGTADDNITQINYKTAEKQFFPIDSRLRHAKQRIVRGESIIRIQSELNGTKRELDSLIGEVRELHPNPIFGDQAERYYAAGMTGINNWDLRGAQEGVTRLMGVRSDIQEFPRLVSEESRLYGSVKSVAIENVAKRQADELHSQAQTYEQHINAQRLREVIDKFRELDTLLRQQYTITIVTRPGIKSGIDRYFTDEHGRRSSGYYLIVEALDGNGNALPIRIRSEENRNIQEVTMWGERVPEEVYERVKNDKLDDGIIQDDVFGRKKIGYIALELTFRGVPPNRRGQITSW